jgi:hypothetical protein
MALTLTLAPNGIEVGSNKVTKTWNAAFTTYTALGEPLTPRQLGMTALDFLEIEPSAYGGVSLVYDWNATTPKLQAYVTNATPSSVAVEVTAATDLSWLGMIKLRARGTS